MFTYSHANTPPGQSERAYYHSYFIICYSERELRETPSTLERGKVLSSRLHLPVFRQIQDT